MTDTTAPAEPGMEEYAAMRAKGSVTPQLAKFAAAAPAVVEAVAAEAEADPAALAEEVLAEETTAAVEETPAPAAPAPKRNGINERLSDMASRRDAEAAARQAADARADKLAEGLAEAIAALKALNPPPQVVASPAKVELEPRPNRASFDDPDAYETAFEGWVTRTATATALAEVTRRETETKAVADRQAAERAQTQQRTALEQSWAEKAAAAAEKHEDFTETIYSDNVQISRPMMQMIMTLENGADIAYHLGKHPAQAAKIAGMVFPGQFYPEGHEDAGYPVPNMALQIFEMGKLAEKLATPAVAPVAAPRVPPPPKPISGNTAVAERSFDDMSADEYARATGRETPSTMAEFRRLQRA